MGLGNIEEYLNENWHGGQIEGDYFTHPEMTIEENGRPEKRKGQLWNWEYSVSRDLMRGRHKSEILAKYKDVMDRFGIRKDVCDFLDRNDCVLGWFIVDVSKFDDKFGYKDIPEEMRVCNLYALNATELREVISRSLVSENDGTMDGFLGGEDGIEEEVNYIDECTGLPCIDGWDGESDDDDERLSAIADIFLGRKWMSLAEKDGFSKVEGKLPYLVSIVKRHFAPKSRSNGKFDDDVNDYDVKGQELEADSQKAYKEAEVNNIREGKMDDIGHVEMPEKYDIADEHKKSDYRQDVSLGKKVQGVNVDRLKDPKQDDIGDIAEFKSVGLGNDIRELHKKDFKDEFQVGKGIKDVQVDELDKDIESDIEFGNLSNNSIDMDEMMKSDSIKGEVEFDESADDFVIEDLEDMEDDEFDYGDLNEGDVDMDEMMDEDAITEEVDIEDVPEEVEISDKYDWSW